MKIHLKRKQNHQENKLIFTFGYFRNGLIGRIKEKKNKHQHRKLTNSRQDRKGKQEEKANHHL